MMSSQSGKFWVRTEEFAKSICLTLGKHPGWLLSTSNFIITLAIMTGYLIDRMSWAFSETGFGTYYSGLQIFLIAISCLLISNHVFKIPTELNKRHKLVWRIAAFGFFYLCLDELAQFHEKLDYAIHFMFSIQETKFTDMIDDAILLSIIIFGGLFLLFNRKVFLRDYGYTNTYAFSFVLLVGMMLVDIILGGAVDLSIDFIDAAAQVRITNLAYVLEDSLKIWGGTFLLMAVSGVLVKIKSNVEDDGN